MSPNDPLPPVVSRRGFLGLATGAAMVPAIASCSGTDQPAASMPADSSTTAAATSSTTVAPPDEGTMRITVLGSGTPAPHPDRAGPSTLVQVAGASLLVDAGRGVLMRLAGAGVNAPRLDAVLLTHLHSDHICDLNDVITTRWALSLDPNPLTVIGPRGTARFVERTLAMLEDDIGYRLEHHDDLTDPPDVQVTEVSEGEVDLGMSGLTVLAAPTEHKPVNPTVGYRFEAGDAVGAVVGDTVPCEGLDRLADGADIYVQTTIRADQVQAADLERMTDTIDYHSTVEQAADTARRLGVGTLVMTHLFPVPPADAAEEQEWIDRAAETFGGTIIVARDLTAVEA